MAIILKLQSLEIVWEFYKGGMRILQTPLALHLHLNCCRLLERGIFRTQSSSKRWMVDGAHETWLRCVCWALVSSPCFLCGYAYSLLWCRLLALIWMAGAQKCTDSFLQAFFALCFLESASSLSADAPSLSGEPMVITLQSWIWTSGMPVFSLTQGIRQLHPSIGSWEPN